MLLNLLPARNKSTIIKKLQVLVNQQSLGNFTGLHVDPRELRTWLDAQFGNTFRVASAAQDEEVPQYKDVALRNKAKMLEVGLSERNVIEMGDPIIINPVEDAEQMKDQAAERYVDILQAMEEAYAKQSGLESMDKSASFITSRGVLTVQVKEVMIEQEYTIEPVRQKRRWVQLKDVTLEWMQGNILVDKKEKEFPQYIVFKHPNARFIMADVRTFKPPRKYGLLSVDPPWTVNGPRPTRGVILDYQTLSDNQIFALELSQYQNEGVLMYWTINRTFAKAVNYVLKQGYEICDFFVWVKLTRKGKINSNVGYYLAHGKELAIVAVKGAEAKKRVEAMKWNTVYFPRLPKSQKPEAAYRYLEELGVNQELHKADLFGRQRNARDGWTVIGNEV